MKKGWKVLLVIISIILISTLLPVMLMNNSYFELPFGFASIRSFSEINYFLRQYLFWSATIFILLLLILIVVILFYPKAKETFVLKEDKGTLTLKKSAIEGYVSSKLNQREFVEKPRINVHATERKIKVNVNGKLKRTSSLIGKTDVLMKEIQQELQQMLGKEKAIDVNVNFTNFDTEKSKKNTDSRVQ